MGVPEDTRTFPPYSATEFREFEQSFISELLLWQQLECTVHANRSSRLRPLLAFCVKSREAFVSKWLQKWETANVVPQVPVPSPLHRSDSGDNTSCSSTAFPISFALPLRQMLPPSSVIAKYGRLPCMKSFSDNWPLERAQRKNASFSHFNANTEAAYLRDLRCSHFALTKKRGGWDSLRHYEIMAAGAVPYFYDLWHSPASVLRFFPREVLLDCVVAQDNHSHSSHCGHPNLTSVYSTVGANGCGPHPLCSVRGSFGHGSEGTVHVAAPRGVAVYRRGKYRFVRNGEELLGRSGAASVEALARHLHQYTLTSLSTLSLALYVVNTVLSCLDAIRIPSIGQISLERKSRGAHGLFHTSAPTSGHSRPDSPCNSTEAPLLNILFIRPITAHVDYLQSMLFDGLRSLERVGAPRRKGCAHITDIDDALECGLRWSAPIPQSPSVGNRSLLRVTTFHPLPMYEERATLDDLFPLSDDEITSAFTLEKLQHAMEAARHRTFHAMHGKGTVFGFRQQRQNCTLVDAVSLKLSIASRYFDAVIYGSVNLNGMEQARTAQHLRAATTAEDELHIMAMWFPLLEDVHHAYGGRSVFFIDGNDEHHPNPHPLIEPLCRYGRVFQREN